MSSKCGFVTLLILSVLSLLSSTSALVLWQQQSVQHYRYARTYSRIPLVVRNAVTTLSNNEELLPGITAINESNDDLNSKLSKLCDHLFFRLFSIDILASCEYMPQELFECYTETCEIYPEDEEAVPASIRVADMDEHFFELDGWSRWDMPSSDYFDTQTFPEGYTGYDGSEVWEFIHDRICFKGYNYDDDHWKADFNKAVSGLHSMVSAQVIFGIKEKIDDGIEFGEAEVWRDPKAEFQRRLSPKGETPQALENLYFCYMLLLTATSKAGQRLLSDCVSGKIDPETAADLKLTLSCALLREDSVGIASRKLHDHAVRDSDSVDALWDARMRSRDLLRIMNCVQCNKCRLHGKIAFLGLATALKILVGHSGEGSDPGTLHRVELAALMTTLHRCSNAVQFCQEMQRN